MADLLLGHAGVGGNGSFALGAPEAADPVAIAMARLRQREGWAADVTAFQAALVQKGPSLDLLLLLADRLTKLERRAEAATTYAAALKFAPERQELRHLVAALGGAPAPARADDTYVASLFDAAAATFDTVLVDQLGYRAPQLVADAALAQGAKVDALDLGCGTGLLGPLVRPFARRLDGVDLSAGMVERARARRCYDDLAVAEIGAWLDAATRRYGLVCAADVFVYFGDLAPLAAPLARVMQPGGVFVFTVEAGQGGWTLSPSGRYRHGDDHVRAAFAGFTVAAVQDVTLRLEQGRPVQGRLYTLVLAGQA